MFFFYSNVNFKGSAEEEVATRVKNEQISVSGRSNKNDRLLPSSSRMPTAKCPCIERGAQ